MMGVLERTKVSGPAAVSRRVVLAGMGGAALAAGAAVLCADRVASANPSLTQGMARAGPLKASQAEVTGYHVTEHIRRYYRTARL
ncbi:MAG: hypothetical protein KGL42_07395 [Betaproteobacteria bacterium]|nr:hypothetical protein [Betaproteobacteria bacterium]